MNRYPLIIFDFDGTLADSFSWFVLNYNKAAQRFGFKPLPKKEIESFRRLDPDSLRCRLNIAFWKLPFVAHHMRKRMAGDIRGIKTFRGIPAVLEKLRRKGRILALVSSNSKDNIRKVLGPETIGLFERMELGVGMSGKVRALKRILRWSRLPASEAIYIADERRDAEAVRKTGIAFGAVSWGYCPLDALMMYSPEVVFRKVSDLLTKT